MNDGPIFEWGPDMPFDDDVADNESDNDVSVASVPIVSLLLTQPVPPLPADNVSIYSEGSTTDANVSSDDDDTTSHVPADIPAAPVDDFLSLTMPLFLFLTLFAQIPLMMLLLILLLMMFLLMMFLLLLPLCLMQPKNLSLLM